MKSTLNKPIQWLKPGKLWIPVATALVCVAGIGLTHHSQPKITAHATSPTATVGVAKVTREDLFTEVKIPAEFRPYEDVELNAKVSGYLKSITVDFGDKVKAGELLATLEVPELKDQLASAEATEYKAEADYTNANLIYTRLMSVNQNHPNLVAEQDLDTAQANADTAGAAVAAARAEVEKYQTLISYTRITAPFDGIITYRYADPGDLIQAGTSSDTQARPLVRVSDNYRLRLDFPVTVNYVKDIELGDPIKVRVDSLNGESFIGTISRFTDDVTENTRTMTTEIEVPNPELRLVPGMYATVTLQVEKRPRALAVPIQAVTGDKSPSVYVVSHDDQIEKRPVQLGLETPDKYEVLSGLNEGEMVVIGGQSRLQSGQKVIPELIHLSLK